MSNNASRHAVFENCQLESLIEPESILATNTAHKVVALYAPNNQLPLLLRSTPIEVSKCSSREVPCWMHCRSLDESSEGHEWLWAMSPTSGSIWSDGQPYKFNKSMNKQMDFFVQKNAKALWTMVALQPGFTNLGAPDWVLDLFWSSTTASTTKDGRSQASACSDIQSYSVLLELSCSLLHPTQAPTASRHWDRMSTTSLRWCGVEIQNQVSSAYSLHHQMSFPNNFM